MGRNDKKIKKQIALNKKIILSRLKEENIFLEVTTKLYADESTKKINQIVQIRNYFEKYLNAKKSLFGIAYIKGNKINIKKPSVDFCLEVKYEEDILKNILAELYGQLPISFKSKPLKGHINKLYIDQQSVLYGLKRINQKYNIPYRTLFDPKLKCKIESIKCIKESLNHYTDIGKEVNNPLIKELSKYVNKYRTGLGISSMKQKKILDNIGIIQGVTLENYLYSVFIKGLENAEPHLRIGYNRDEKNLSDKSDNTSYGEIDLLITGKNLFRELKNFFETNTINPYPKEFYKDFTSC